MRITHLSPLGFLMDAMKIQTVTMARYLHVDASLVSKWKSGGRSLTERSVYFDDVIAYLADAAQQMPQAFYDALSQILPSDKISTQDDPKLLLRKALSLQKLPGQHPSSMPLLEGGEQTTAFLFDGSDGIRSAISKLLACAENLSKPGELIFIDTSEYRWLVTDETFAARFTKRLLHLLSCGFRVRFVIHYSASREHSIQLFTAISPLIFRRNVDWYYFEYYDDTLFRPSLFLLRRTLSLMAISSGNIPATLMAFTDLPLIMRHESLAEQVIHRCRPIFENIPIRDFPSIAANMFRSRRRGALYAFLPAPAFLFSPKELLQAIMQDNPLSKEARAACLALNKVGTETEADYIDELSDLKEPFVQIFQLEEMVRRAHTQPFVSGSLSLASGIHVKIHPHRYAHQLRTLANDLIRYDNFSVVLVSETDNAPLPAINCWCKQYTWLIQMDKEGFRLSDEASIVSAASVALERCIRHIPPERKDKKSVHDYLLNLADELEQYEAEADSAVCTG